MARSVIAFVVLGVVALLLLLWGWQASQLQPLPTDLVEQVAAQDASGSVVGVATGPNDASGDAEVARDVAPEVLAPPTYKLRGTVTRAGLPQPMREVVCYRGWGQSMQQVRTDQAGAFCFEVTAADYELHVLPAEGVSRGRQTFGTAPFTWRPQVFTGWAAATVVDADQHVSVELPVQRLVVNVRNAETLEPIADADIAWCPPIPVVQELHVTTDRDGFARIAEVCPGQHVVLAVARAFLPAEQIASLVANGPDAMVSLLLQPTGAVDVVMVDGYGQPVAVSRAQGLALQPEPKGTPAFPSNRRQFLSSERVLVTQFDELAPGSYQVRLDGDVYDHDGKWETVRYSPCVQRGPHRIQVTPGVVVRVDVPVVQRAYATLRAVDMWGALVDGELRVERIGSDGVVRRVLPAPWQSGNRHGDSHYEGYLEHGTYALVFTAQGRSYSEQLLVAKDQVDYVMHLAQ